MELVNDASESAVKLIQGYVDLVKSKQKLQDQIQLKNSWKKPKAVSAPTQIWLRQLLPRLKREWEQLVILIFLARMQ